MDESMEVPGLGVAAERLCTSPNFAFIAGDVLDPLLTGFEKPGVVVAIVGQGPEALYLPQGEVRALTGVWMSVDDELMRSLDIVCGEHAEKDGESKACFGEKAGHVVVVDRARGGHSENDRHSRSGGPCTRGRDHHRR